MISIQSRDDKNCLNLCLVNYLNHSDHYPVTFRKTDKDFARKLDYKFIKISVKIRGIHKTDKDASASARRIKKKYKSMFQKVYLRDILTHH